MAPQLDLVSRRPRQSEATMPVIYHRRQAHGVASARQASVILVVLALFTTEAEAMSASGRSPSTWWETVLTYSLASLAFVFFAWVAALSRRARLRDAIRKGRLVREHVEVLMVMAERCAGDRATRARNLSEQLDMDKRQAKAALKELTKSGCVKAGQLGGYVPTEAGLEFLQTLDVGEFASEAAEVLEAEERLRRVCGLAAASSAMAGVSGGDAGGG